MPRISPPVQRHRDLRRLTVRRLTATLAAVAVGLLAGAMATGSPAAAHTALVSSSPANGATLTTPPRTVRLVFSGAPASGTPVDVAVTLAGQEVPPAGSVRVDGSTLVIPVNLPGSGTYTVAYRVVSADGHPVQGTVAFTVSDTPGGAAASASPSPAASASVGASASAAARPTAPVPPPKDTSRWPHLVIALVVLILVAIAVALATGPKRPKRPRI
jgi:methionine-rich copper-binding protein CopC